MYTAGNASFSLLCYCMKCKDKQKASVLSFVITTGKRILTMLSLIVYSTSTFIHLWEYDSEKLSSLDWFVNLLSVLVAFNIYFSLA